eukprot:68780-Karenia_brevis.AAC.1
MCVVESSISKAFVSTASTSFVDDLATSIITASSAEVPTLADSITSKLDQAFLVYGMKQNKQKAQSLLDARGFGAKKVHRNMMVENIHGITSEARYLGPVINWKNSAVPEVGALQRL